MSRTDRLIGIGLGIVVGIVALILFIFLGSSDSIDAPSIDGQAPPAQHARGSAP
jgi:hypothetical protein